MTDFVSYGDLEVRFDDDAIMLRPQHLGTSCGVVGLFDNAAIDSFLTALMDGTWWAYRKEGEYEAVEYRLFVDTVRYLIVWQGSFGNAYQSGSGPYITRLDGIALSRLIHDIQRWLKTHTTDNSGVVWIL